jgi:hypothetical protein
VGQIRCSRRLRVVIAMDEQRMMFLLRQSLGETNATLSRMVEALQEIALLRAETQRLALL